MFAIRMAVVFGLLEAVLLTTAPAPQAAPATYYVDAVNGVDDPAAGMMSPNTQKRPRGNT